MKPANTPLCLIPGTTNRSILRVMQPTWIYKPITSIAAGAPVQLTVPDHNMPAGGWPGWIAGVQSAPELNRQPPLDQPHRLRVIDGDTLSIDSISTTGRKPSGAAMELRYHPPVDLTGAEVQMKMFDRPGGVALMTLTLGDGLTITGPGTIERLIEADTPIPPAITWYWIEVRYPDGTEHRYWEGPVNLSET